MPNPITPGRPLRLYTKDSKFCDVSTDALVGEKMNHFKGWVCGLGTQNLYVDMDGGVFGASCRVGGSMGNVFEDINLPKNWLSCTKNACSCGADQFIPKAKDSLSKKYLLNTLGLDQISMIPKPVDSSADFVALEPSDPQYSRQVYWELGRRCNYDCSYCFPGIHNKTDPHKSLTDLLKATILVQEKFCNNQPAHFVISGGEPTLNPALMDWVKFLYSMGHRVSMHTNGSRHFSYYLELFEYVHMNISVHFDFYQPERLLKTITELTNKRVLWDSKQIGHLEVKLMAGPDKVTEALEFEKKLRSIPNFKKFCTWAIVPIREGDFGELIASGYKDSDFQLFGDRA